MKRPKSTFGTSCTCKVRYVIAILFTDNTYKYVTKVETYPHKWCEWNDGEKAYFFDDKVYAEEVCLGLNVNGTGAFAVEVPGYFGEKNFTNVKKEEENEEK